MYVYYDFIDHVLKAVWQFFPSAVAVVSNYESVAKTDTKPCCNTEQD